VLSRGRDRGRADAGTEVVAAKLFCDGGAGMDAEVTEGISALVAGFGTLELVFMAGNRCWKEGITVNG